MNTRKKTEHLIRILNKRMLGTTEVEWNTPGAFFLTSYKPGTKRLYTVERNAVDGSGVERKFTGYAGDVYDYMRGVIDGTSYFGDSKYERMG